MWVLLYGMTWWCLLAPANQGCLLLLNYYMKLLNWCHELTLIHLKHVRCTPEKYCQPTVQVSPSTACSWGWALPHLSLVLGLTFLNYQDLRKKFPPKLNLQLWQHLARSRCPLIKFVSKWKAPSGPTSQTASTRPTFLVQASPTEPGQQVKQPAIPELG